MLDQTFSVENFKKIIFSENQKGIYLEGKYFPKVAIIIEKIKQCNSDIRTLKKEAPFTKRREYTEKLETINEAKFQLQDEKDIVISKELEIVIDHIEKQNLTFDIEEITTPNNKTAYHLSIHPNAYINAAQHFCLKQIQRNLLKIYKVKQDDKDLIVEQLAASISGKYKRAVYKTDIKSFYEQIDSQAILEKIANDNLLVPSSRKVIKKVLYAYWALSGKTVGVPRGLGISAYLVELFMRPIDKELSSLHGVTYYARYVDDIIIINSPAKETMIDSGRVKHAIESSILSHNLILNTKKTKLTVLHKDQQCNFDFLGYKLIFDKGRITIGLSSKKMERYRARLLYVFNYYDRTAGKNEVRAAKLLYQRLLFLTSNTRLINRKKNVIVGIYFSNKLLTDLNNLASLDAMLDNLEQNIKNPRYRSLTSKLSYKSGFLRRDFVIFKPNELKKIGRGLNHVTSI